ncbi:multidrug resistance efflux transporter family protein [Paenibacillus shunpengii]|uniref:Multidrug resistance efflux transporter family protein n=1 Tax=Paenibacillus shunpengii TaxID=2054424 RepID=A0ABW5SMA9_9BACL
MKPVFFGVASAFFFAFAFVLNASMELSGGNWAWSASLRFLFMLPILLCIVLIQKKWHPLWAEMRRQPKAWLLWSTVGFGLFYAPICFSTAFSHGWLIAGTWQVTIISGILLTPLFSEKVSSEKGLVNIRYKIPIQSLFMSLFILLGIILMQIDQAKTISFHHLLLGTIPVLIASFAYPLGNRKMMELCEGRIDTIQRVLGMTIASLPVWLILSLYALSSTGLPSLEQSLQSLLVALFSGVIATILFFKATEMVRKNMRTLAAVEATQSMELLFALIGEILFLSLPLPSLLSWCGIIIVMLGMILHSFAANKMK